MHRDSFRSAFSAVFHAAVALVVLTGSAAAQLPAAPVLQNAWATPGIVAAVNVAGASNNSIYAAAASWGASRFQISGGIGVPSRSGTAVGTGSKTAYGVRVAVPFGGASSAFGFAAFAGIGGTSGSGVKVADTLGIPAAADSVPWTTEVPLGVSIGWRRAIGSNHGLSVYATPAYINYSGGSRSSGLFRVGLGADFGITSSIGATVGADFGGTRPSRLGGPSSTQFGAGVSYAFGRR